MKNKSGKIFLIFYSIFSTAISFISTILYAQKTKTEFFNHRPGNPSPADYFIEGIGLYFLLEIFFLLIFIIICKIRKEKNSCYLFYGTLQIIFSIIGFLAIYLPFN